MTPTSIGGPILPAPSLHLRATPAVLRSEGVLWFLKPKRFRFTGCFVVTSQTGVHEHIPGAKGVGRSFALGSGSLLQSSARCSPGNLEASAS